MKNSKLFIALWLLASIFSQTITLHAQQNNEVTANVQPDGQLIKNLMIQSRGSEFPALLEKIFGDEAQAAADALNEDSERLLESVSTAASARAEAILDDDINARREKKSSNTIIEPGSKTKPSTKTKPAVRTKRTSYNFLPQTNWRQFTFGFQPASSSDKPEIKMTETDKEVRATGETKKNFETKEAKGMRTQKSETVYTKDGKVFGMEIKDMQIIEAVSKLDGKSFRREVSMQWGAEVAACPDVNGVSAGTGKAKIVSKTTYIEGGAPIVMTSDFDLQAKLTGYVNDRAEMTHYDLTLDAYTTNSGYEEALQRNIVKEIKLKDGRYGLRYDIPRNTIEISDGKYGGNRTPAKMGKATARTLTPMNNADANLVGSAIGPMVPTIWHSANEMYKTAERHWKNYGCVEVVCRVPKKTLEPNEEIVITAESVHLQDNSKINAEMKAEAFTGQVTPEEQTAKPSASFTFTQEGEENASFTVESFSRRGIGKGDVEFEVKKEKEETAEKGAWTGTITAVRQHREEREKRSGANLAENGGYLETNTDVRIELTGRIDRSVDATNAHIAAVSGTQAQIDYEYDRYKIDEGYCGPGAVPYKGPKENTRTSTTTVYFSRETRVFVEIGTGVGTISFSLPEQNGSTIHRYVQKSPCPDHDRVNTNDAIDEETPTIGGSFSFSFPMDAAQKIVKGSLTVRGEDGSSTTYTWELSRR